MFSLMRIILSFGTDAMYGIMMSSTILVMKEVRSHEVSCSCCSTRALHCCLRFQAQLKYAELKNQQLMSFILGRFGVIFLLLHLHASMVRLLYIMSAWLGTNTLYSPQLPLAIVGKLL
jgi:hypothetical protein